MNLLLIERHELEPDGCVTIEDRRAEHLHRVLKVEKGSPLRAGLVGGKSGTATVESVRQSRDGKERSTRVRLKLQIDPGSAERPNLDLVLGLPRPAVLHRVLQHSAAIGIGRLDLINAWRVEKSFFQSPALETEAIRRHLLLGLEQGRRTWLPEVHIHRRLVPFVEALAAPAPGEKRLLTHPEAGTPIEQALGSGVRGRVVLAIGPEGGWIDREIETFAGAGFAAATLGPWVLRSEAAISAAVAQLELLRRLPVEVLAGDVPAADQL